MEKPLRILIVEDEPILALELKEDLQDLGYEVSDVVADGDMVLHSFLRNRPDVILMDIKLHGFRDGIDSAVQIRGFYKVPVVYLSSYPESEVGERLPKTAPYVYIEKPYDIGRLHSVLKDVIQGAS